jgi:hypothetical protein
VTFLAVSIGTLLFWGCAEVGAPPGGEVDRTGPRLVESYPPNGATGVTPDGYISLKFSETLVKPDQGSVVFISPRPSRPPVIEWKAKELLIKLPELFKTNQTYVVSVSTTLTDLRRNRLDSAATVAFSTGQVLDSGLIAGQVWNTDTKPAVGWVVGLYQAGALENYRFADSLYPQYLTTVATDGQFSLRYLPATAFSLLAFEDKNRDELFNPAIEPYALPDRAIMVGGSLHTDHLNLCGTSYDSIAPGIISTVVTKDRLLRIRLTRKINPTYLATNCAQTILQPLSDTLAPGLQCKGVFETGPELSDVLTLYVPDLTENTYRLSLYYRVDAAPLIRDSVIVKLPKDDVPPVVAVFLPGNKPMFVEQVRMALTFSEPVKPDKLTDQTLMLWDGDRRIGCTAVWDDVFRVALTPQRLEAGKKYRLDVAEYDIRDFADNALGDSLLSFPFATLDEDSVGSISGQVLINLPGKESQIAILSFNETATKRRFTLNVPAVGSAALAGRRDFEMKVPPGKYLLSGFLDQDGDGSVTPGAIRPLRLAETQINYPDTITVRARFETAGTQLVFE